MKYFGSILSISNISPRNAHGWGLNLKENSILSLAISAIGVPHTSARIRNRMVSKIVRANSEIKKIVDVGSGIGLTGFYLNQFGYDYVGIDKSNYKIEIANRLIKKGRFKKIKFIRADIFKLDSSDKFDCALNMEVLEHVEDPAGLLSKISSFVKPGGYIILSTPSSHYINSLSQKYFGHVSVGFEPKDIKKLINEKELKVEEISYFGNGIISKAGFLIDFLLMKYFPIFAGVYFFVFYPIAVLDQEFFKSSNPLGYVITFRKRV